MRLIDADAFEQDLKEKLLPLLVKKYGKEEAMKGLHFSLQDCISNIQSQPTITQPERKKGSWNVIQGNIVVCSECGMLAPKSMTGCLLNRYLEPNRTNFCPNCGADMRKREGDNV